MKKLLLLLITFSFVHAHAQKEIKHSILKESTVWLKGVDDNKNALVLNGNKAIISLKDKIIKRKLASANSLFVVYSFDSKKETTILNLNKRKQYISLNTTGLVSFGKKTALKTSHPQGKITTIQFFNTHLKRGNININESFLNDTKNALYELIYFPQYISITKKQKIETYLALKYGISLDKKQNYYDSDYQIIWNAADNVDFSNHVFGIGYDEKLNLNQKTAIHSEDDFLQISYLDEDATLEKQFLLLGDNGKSNVLSLEDGVEKMPRTWLFNAVSDEDTAYTFTLSRLDTITAQNQWQYKIAISDSPNITVESARFIQATATSKNQVFFDEIRFNEGEKYFTFMKFPKNYTKEKIFSVYPNPVSKNQPLNIYIKNPTAENVAIVIYTISGQLVFSEEDVVLDKQLFTYQLPSAGVYTVSVTVGDKTSTTKIISK